MRKTKDIKRKRVNAGIEYRKGKRDEAYKMWREAKNELDALRKKNKPAEQKPAEQAEAKPAEQPAS